jgi:hypothetical protein
MSFVFNSKENQGEKSGTKKERGVTTPPLNKLKTKQTKQIS